MSIAKSDFGNCQLASGLSVSRLAFGTSPLGSLYAPVSQHEGVATVQHVIGRGIKYLDSALLYGGGKALETLGIGLGESPASDLAISFKVGRVLLTGPNDQNARGRKLQRIQNYVGSEERLYVFDYTARGVQTAFDQSMEYLNKGRFSRKMSPIKPQDLNLIIYAHDPGVDEHGSEQPKVMKELLQEGFPRLFEMQKAGIIKAYGVGTNEIQPCIQALSDPHIKLLLLAGRGTLLCNGAPKSTGTIKEDSAHFPELLKTIKAHPNAPKLVVASIANSGLAYGGSHYNYKPANQSALDFRNEFDAAIAEYNKNSHSAWTMKDLLIHYPLDHFGDAVAAVMPGPRNISEFEETAQTYAKKIPRELWIALTQRGLLNPEYA